VDDIYVQTDFLIEALFLSHIISGKLCLGSPLRSEYEPLLR